MSEADGLTFKPNAHVACYASTKIPGSVEAALLLSELQHHSFAKLPVAAVSDIGAPMGAGGLSHDGPGRKA